jgi:hypothetical protein
MTKALTELARTAGNVDVSTLDARIDRPSDSRSTLFSAILQVPMHAKRA